MLAPYAFVAQDDEEQNTYLGKYVAYFEATPEVVNDSLPFNFYVAESNHGLGLYAYKDLVHGSFDMDITDLRYGTTVTTAKPLKKDNANNSSYAIEGTPNSNNGKVKRVDQISAVHPLKFMNSDKETPNTILGSDFKWQPQHAELKQDQELTWAYDFTEHSNPDEDQKVNERLAKSWVRPFDTKDKDNVPWPMSVHRGQNKLVDMFPRKDVAASIFRANVNGYVVDVNTITPFNSLLFKESETGKFKIAVFCTLHFGPGDVVTIAGDEAKVKWSVLGVDPADKSSSILKMVESKALQIKSEASKNLVFDHRPRHVYDYTRNPKDFGNLVTYSKDGESNKGILLSEVNNIKYVLPKLSVSQLGKDVEVDAVQHSKSNLRSSKRLKQTTLSFFDRTII